MIFCLTARRMQHFKKTVVLYPLCILAIWLPCVFLGVAANAMHDIPAIAAKLDARALLLNQDPLMTTAQVVQLQQAMAGDDVIILMLEHYAPLWMAGLLGAGIMAAVMASDSQILALSTMFTQDIFTFYGGRARFGEWVQVQMGRLFVVLITAVAYFYCASFSTWNFQFGSAVRIFRLCSALSTTCWGRCFGNKVQNGAH